MPQTERAMHFLNDIRPFEALRSRCFVVAAVLFLAAGCGETKSLPATDYAAEDVTDVIAEDGFFLRVGSPQLSAYLDQHGLGATVARMARAAARKGRECHEQAHHLGRMAYDRVGALAIAQASHECHSGASHGATEAMFKDRGTQLLETDMDEICGGMVNSFYVHQCLHGVGHGLMAWTEYELYDALGHCDRLGAQMGRESCYSGVFMENVVGGLSGSMGNVTQFLSDDPHYPCNALDDRYVRHCYFYQTSRMVVLFRGDFGEVADACAEVPLDATSYCFLSMGRDVGGRTRGNPRKSIQFCAEVEDLLHRLLCLDGAVQDTFWDPSGADDALLFCRTLEDPEEKNGCYRTIMARAREVLQTADERSTFCAAVEEPWRGECGG